MRVDRGFRAMGRYGRVMSWVISGVVSAAALGACSSDGPSGSGGVKTGVTMLPSYCMAAKSIAAGAAYYEVPAQCDADAYAKRASFLAHLDHYRNDTDFIAAVCGALSASEQSECESTTSAFYFGNELTGLANIVTATTGRTESCQDMAPETASVVGMTLDAYVEKACPAANGTTSFCEAAEQLIAATTYYGVVAQCVADAYADKSAVEAVLAEFTTDAAFSQAVCSAMPAVDQHDCTTGAYSLKSEMTGFHNIVDASPAERSDVCGDMAAETSYELRWYMSTYATAYCAN